jgi:hypothetical protein
LFARKFDVQQIHVHLGPCDKQQRLEHVFFDQLVRAGNGRDLFSHQRHTQAGLGGAQHTGAGLPIDARIGKAHEALDHAQFADELLIGGRARCQPCQAVAQLGAAGGHGVGLRFERLHR